ncbi:MAG: lytic transglycosylase domain-containing protein [Streptosporangiaceae bacterium]
MSQPELTDRLALPQAQTDSQITFSLAQRADQIRDVSAQRAATQQLAAKKMAARVARRTVAAQSQAAPAAGPRPPAASAAPAATGSPQRIAEAMLGSFGWSASQFSCLDPLWEHESGWSVTAYNPGTGAYGIPQAMPGGKMASAGADWQTDAATQIRWGLSYIRDTYGSPCGAWDHEEATGWY